MHISVRVTPQHDTEEFVIRIFIQRHLHLIENEQREAHLQDRQTSRNVVTMRSLCASSFKKKMSIRVSISRE